MAGAPTPPPRTMPHPAPDRPAPGRPAPPADVALVLEGTYPTALGGVSTWVHGLVSGLPGVRFGLVHLYAGAPGADRFDVPPNVVWRRTLRLPDDLGTLDADALARRVPATPVVHALSAGFAGLVGAAVKRGRGGRLLVTEHGVAWHEVAEGAPELETGLRLVGADRSAGDACASRALWVRRLQDVARAVYAAADRVTTVTAANRPLQAAVGCRGAEVIPNGTAPPARLGPLDAGEVARLDARAGRPAPVRVGFVGRVTPLKDVAAFVRTAARVAEAVPAAAFFAVGPAEDAGYVAECRALAGRLGVGVAFTGPQPVDLWLRHLDVVVLASRSEAEPLVLLEAMAHGTPVVTLDVGGCRALVAGRSAPPGGLVVAPPRPDAVVPDAAPALADAVVRLVRDPALRRRLGGAGRGRAAGRTAEAVARRYAEVYRELAGPDAAPPGGR